MRCLLKSSMVSHRKPVLPWIIWSRCPPLLVASIGHPLRIASATPRDHGSLRV